MQVLYVSKQDCQYEGPLETQLCKLVAQVVQMARLFAAVLVHEQP